MDIWSKEKRSLVMSRIRSKNTKPEIVLRSALFKLGFRFRIHRKDLPGKPDIVFSKQRVVVLVQGCFWHYHQNCQDGRIPKSNFQFWKDKLNRNVTRDIRNRALLESLKWRVITIWECEVEKSLPNTLQRITSMLTSI